MGAYLEHVVLFVQREMFRQDVAYPIVNDGRRRTLFRFFRRRRVFLFRRSGLCFFIIHHRIRGRSRGPAIGRDRRPITRTTTTTTTVDGGVPTVTMTTPGGGRGGGIHLRPGRGWKLGLSGGTFRARRWHSFFLSFFL